MQFHWKESLIFVLKAAKEKGISLGSFLFGFGTFFHSKLKLLGSYFRVFLL